MDKDKILKFVGVAVGIGIAILGIYFMVTA